MCALWTFSNLRWYILQKEDNFWKPDVERDGHMDFDDAFYPMQHLGILCLIKMICCRTEFIVEYLIGWTCLAFFVLDAYYMFDAWEGNNPPIWRLAIPLSVFLLVLAWVDLKFYLFTDDLKKRIFYNLDAPHKRVCVYGHVIASMIYGGLVFFWLLRIEVNAENKAGAEEDSKLVHLALSSFVFYAIFTIERHGNYMLNLF